MFEALTRLGHTLTNFTDNVIDDYSQDGEVSRVAGYSDEEAGRFLKKFERFPIRYGALGQGQSPVLTRYRSALVIGSADAETMADTLKENGATDFFFTDPQASIGISFIEHHPQFGVTPDYLGSNAVYHEIVFAVEVELSAGGKAYCPFDRVRVTTQESHDVGQVLGVPKTVLADMRFDGADNGIDIKAFELGGMLVNLSWHGTTFPVDAIANLMNSSQVFVNWGGARHGLSLLEVFARHRGMRFINAPFRSQASDPLASGVHFGVTKGNGEFFIGGGPGEILKRAMFTPERLLFSRPDGGSLGVFAPILVWQ